MGSSGNRPKGEYVFFDPSTRFNSTLMGSTLRAGIVVLSRNGATYTSFNDAFQISLPRSMKNLKVYL